jgi:hypothetical protein
VGRVGAEGAGVGVDVAFLLAAPNLTCSTPTPAAVTSLRRPTLPTRGRVSARVAAPSARNLLLPILRTNA